MMYLTIAYVLLILAAAPATAFPICYAWFSRGVWHTHPTGRALMLSSTALAVLLDWELLTAVVPVPPEVEQSLTLAILALIAGGAWLKLGALLYEARHRHDEGGQ